MARIQQSIDINVPVRVAYNQLTQFEDYPRFMDEVDAVRQLDDTHLHWSRTMAGRSMEWEAEIVEQLPDQCIAWRSIDGPHNAGRLEVQPLGQQQARVTLTMDCEPEALLGPVQGDAEAAVMQRLGQDLTRFKDFIETRGGETGQWRGEVRGGQVVRSAADAAWHDNDGDAVGKAIGQTADELRDGRQSAARPSAAAPAATSPGYAAGSEGWDGSEEELPPPGSRYQEQASLPFGRQQEQSTQPDASLSESTEGDDGRFSVAAEQSFDQQSDQARRVGRMPQDLPGADPADAMKAALRRDDAGKKEADQDAGDKTGLAKGIERAVPPSDDTST